MVATQPSTVHTLCLEFKHPSVAAAALLSGMTRIGD